jgi:hypothetical protein
MRRKVPVRLQLKLKNVADPVVGLEFINEFLPITSDEVEPYYEVRFVLITFDSLYDV